MMGDVKPLGGKRISAHMDNRPAGPPEPASPEKMPVEAWQFAFELATWLLCWYTARAANPLSHNGAVAVLSTAAPSFTAKYTQAVTNGKGGK